MTAIHVSEGLHLKSSMTMLCENVILVGKSSAGALIRDQIKSNAKFAQDYKFVEIEKDHIGSANVLYFNGRLLYPDSFETLYKQLNEFNQLKFVRSIENSEFKKIDGCLTCRSVFFNRG